MRTAVSPEIWFVAGVRAPSPKVDGPLGIFDAISLFGPVLRQMIGEVADGGSGGSWTTGGRPRKLRLQWIR
jgi:hypothetical protein